MDYLVYNRVISNKKIETRSEVIMTTWSLIRIRVSQLFQRFWSKCLKEGDSNSVFFHAFVKSRYRRNVILTLKIEESWIHMVSKIRQEIAKFISYYFKEPNVYRLCLDGVVFHSLFRK